MWVQLGSKVTKTVIFIPATSLPTQFSLKKKFLRARVFNTLIKLKDKLTAHHKTLQMFIFLTETNR